MIRAIFAAAAAGLFAVGCDNVDQSKPGEGAVTTAPDLTAVTAPAVPVPVLTPMNVSLDWSATGEGSKATATANNGKATLVKGGILSVTGFEAPVAAGDKITIKTSITGPAGRQVRVFAMRHCDAVDESDTSAEFFELTGAALPVEVSHTFSKPYGCAKLALNAVDGNPIDVTLDNVQFFKVTMK